MKARAIIGNIVGAACIGVALSLSWLFPGPWKAHGFLFQMSQFLVGFLALGLNAWFPAGTQSIRDVRCGAFTIAAVLTMYLVGAYAEAWIGFQALFLCMMAGGLWLFIRGLRVLCGTHPSFDSSGGSTWSNRE